jgi:copper chaperone CopZ
MKFKIKLMALTFFLSTSAFAKTQELVQKSYFIKGMVCGMCVAKIKESLDKTPDLKLVSNDVQVGAVNLEFKKADYLNNKTDCMVANTIESSKSYTVYFDKEYSKKACEE